MSTPNIDPSRRINQLLAHYALSHTHPVNVRIHCVAVPLILFSLLGLLLALSPWVAYAFVLASLVYYFRLSIVFCLAMIAVSALMLIVLDVLRDKGVLVPACAGIFVVAWVFQFMGHRIEGKKPSFLEDLQYLWVGPLFVLSHLFAPLDLRW